MAALAGYTAGALVGGTMLVAFLSWVLRKLGGNEPREGLTARLVFAWLLACGVALWGWWGDRSPAILLFISWLANACGALIVRALTLRGAREEDDADAFR